MKDDMRRGSGNRPKRIWEIGEAERPHMNAEDGVEEADERRRQKERRGIREADYPAAGSRGGCER